MEAVCAGKSWDVALARRADGSIAAAMPYLLGRRMGMRFVVQPQLTQYNGPWFSPAADRASASRLLAAHFDGLGLAFFSQNFAPGVELLAGWEGCHGEERVTYRIENMRDMQSVFDGFDKQRRQRPIRRAAKVLAAVENISPEQFADFHAAYWQSRGQKDVLSAEFIVRIVRAALQRGQGLLLGAADDTGYLHAARFVAFDSGSAYALLSALNPEGHHNGASPFLFWEMMQRLSGKTAAFDFEGSMDSGIAFSYSLYGARPVAYRHVTRFRNAAVRRLLCALRVNV